MKRRIDYIIVHCSATDVDVGVREITRWHKKRGFKTIGYHYVVRRNGLIEKGRPESAVGAHCRNANRYSIGVCGCWLRRPTPSSLTAMRELLEELKERYPKAEIRPHSYFPSAKKQGKTCPVINLASFLRPQILPKGV